MIRFNDSNIYVGFIKELLSSFWLPTCRILPPGGDPAAFGLGEGEPYIKGNALMSHSSGGERFLSPYKKGDFVMNLSKRLELRNNYYDSYTHAYLGDYLRYVRDYLGVDLMSMYNCFTWDMPKYVESLEAKDGDALLAEFSSDDPSYDLYMFPAKYGREYTVAMDWHGSVGMCACVYDSNVMVDSDTAGRLASETYAEFSGMRFSSPVVYRGLVGKSGDDSRLKLFVRIPTGCASSIVVLEGDFRESAKTYVSGISVSKSRHADAFRLEVSEDGKATGRLTGESSFSYASKSQLLFTNDGNRNQLADRLIEYLSGNAVSPLDQIDRNVAKLNRKLTFDGTSKALSYGYPGKWDGAMREAIWKCVSDSGLLDSSFDLLGYFDKDAEAAMGGLKVRGGEED